MNYKEKLDYINNELGTDYQSLNMVEWTYVSYHYKLSDNFIREFKDKVDWSQISVYQKLSEDFMREFKDELVWTNISIYQKLSENFIREFHDMVDWTAISKYQKLSENFIMEFSDMVDWCRISAHQKLSDSFICEFGNKINQNLINNNWAYKDAEFLKAQVEATGLYECHDDYFIAYKGIRSDRYSIYNFQYQYLPGKTYEAFCDCFENENSFGLSVWTEDNAMKYSNELVVKVKVRYEDVGRVVHGGGKIRCRKITILG